MIRRKLKNVIKNYTECEILVREATSNESWGPTNSILSKIAELSNHEPNIVHIMPLIWKRLKDKGKKWRHVYKSLLLMHFLVTRGNISISEYCRRNIHFIQSLESFTYIDANVDVGARIRKRASELIVLLKDNDLLKSERQKGMITDLRFSKDIVSQGSNVPIKYGNGVGSMSQGPSTGSFISSSENKEAVKVDYAVPTSSVEEDIQLQIALAESKEEAERLKECDEIKELTEEYKVNLAIKQNLKENCFEAEFDTEPWHQEAGDADDCHNDPWSPEPERRSVPTVPNLCDPWHQDIASNESLWSHGTRPFPAPNDSSTEGGYWSPVEVDPWGVVPVSPAPPPPPPQNPWQPDPSHNPWAQSASSPGGSVTQFLSGHSHLLDIHSLRPSPSTRTRCNNPFLASSRNPFLEDAPLHSDPAPPVSDSISAPHYNPFLS